MPLSLVWMANVLGTLLMSSIPSNSRSTVNYLIASYESEFGGERQQMPLNWDNCHTLEWEPEANHDEINRFLGKCLHSKRSFNMQNVNLNIFELLHSYWSHNFCFQQMDEGTQRKHWMMKENFLQVYLLSSHAHLMKANETVPNRRKRIIRDYKKCTCTSFLSTLANRDAKAHNNLRVECVDESEQWIKLLQKVNRQDGTG